MVLEMFFTCTDLESGMSFHFVEPPVIVITAVRLVSTRSGIFFCASWQKRWDLVRLDGESPLNRNFLDLGQDIDWAIFKYK